MTDSEDSQDDTTRKIEVPWHGPVAAELADAVGQAIREQGFGSLVQSVSGSRTDGLTATIQIRNPHAVLDAAEAALADENPDSYDGSHVTGVDVVVEKTGTLVVTDSERAPTVEGR